MKNTRKKKKSKNYVFLPIILLAIVVIVAIIFFIIKLNDIKGKSQNNVVNLDEVQDVVETENKEVEEAMSFESFVKDSYTQNEIEQFSSQKINEILDNQINYGDVKVIDFKKIAGSVKGTDYLKTCISDFYDDDQFVNTVNVVTETNLYYIVDVNVDYLSEAIQRNYNEKLLVFKNFYYNMNTNTLNMDDLNVVKQILDIKYYVQNYKNSGKRLIQSFIIDDGEKTKYTLYYFDINYGNNKNNIINLVKEETVINSATGVIESVVRNNIKENVVRN